MIAVNFLDVCYNAIGKRTNYCKIIRKAKLCFETRNNTDVDFENDCFRPMYLCST